MDICTSITDSLCCLPEKLTQHLKSIILKKKKKKEDPELCQGGGRRVGVIEKIMLRELSFCKFSTDLVLTFPVAKTKKKQELSSTS